MTKPRSKVTVAQYLELQIAISEKSQKQIAEEIGYDRPNILTMFKQGTTKLPINKVGPLAKALGVDPVHLLRLALQEYMPDTWLAIEPLVGRSLVTVNELALMNALRCNFPGADLDFSDESLLLAMVEAARPFAEKQSVRGERIAAGSRVVRKNAA